MEIVERGDPLVLVSRVITCGVCRSKFLVHPLDDNVGKSPSCYQFKCPICIDVPNYITEYRKNFEVRESVEGLDDGQLGRRVE